MVVDEIRVRVHPDGRVSRKESASFLGVKPNTMAIWAMKGVGPRPIKTGSRTFYLIDDLRRFAGTGCEPVTTGADA